MKDLEQKMHEQFPDSVDKTIEVVGVELDLFDDVYYEEYKREADEEGHIDPDEVAIEKCSQTHTPPKGYIFVTTTDNTLYMVKVD